MANSYYQTPTTPRLYVSYPLWQYANGGLDFYALGGSAYSDGVNVIDEDLIKLTNPPFVVSFILSSYSIEFNLVNVPKSTLS